jgi:hypothetical protein
VSDYSYDEAHDGADQAGSGGGEPAPEAAPPPVTSADDPHGDYGYDLAHDIPRPEAPSG